MGKIIKTIILIALLLIFLLLGVKYSDSIKNSFSWLAETRSEEMQVPSDIQGEIMIRVEQPAPQEVESGAPATATIVPAESLNK